MENHTHLSQEAVITKQASDSQEEDLKAVQKEEYLTTQGGTEVTGDIIIAGIATSCPARLQHMGAIRTSLHWEEIRSSPYLETNRTYPIHNRGHEDDRLGYHPLPAQCSGASEWSIWKMLPG